MSTSNGMARVFLVMTVLVCLDACTSSQLSFEALRQGLGSGLSVKSQEAYTGSQKGGGPQLAKVARAVETAPGITRMARPPLIEWDARLDAGVSFADSCCRGNLDAHFETSAAFVERWSKERLL